METINETKTHPFEKSGLGLAPFTFRHVYEKVVYIPGVGNRAAGSCAHCGTGIRYCYVIESADGRLSDIGCDCILKLADDARLVRTVKSAKKTFEAQREAETKRSKGEAFLHEHGLLEGNHPILDNLRSSARKFGSLTGPQLTFAKKLIAESKERAAAPAPVAKIAGPAPRGRQTVSGTVLNVKTQTSQWGVVFKTLIVLENGARVYGTAPDVVADLKGAKVTFTATFEQNESEDFAFYSRPCKWDVQLKESQEVEG